MSVRLFQQNIALLELTEIVEEGQNLHINTAQTAVVTGETAKVGHGLHGLGRRDARLQLEGKVVEMFAGLGVANFVEDGRDGVVRFGRVVESREGRMLDDGTGINDEGMVLLRLLVGGIAAGVGGAYFGGRRGGRSSWFLLAWSGRSWSRGGLGRRRTRPTASEAAHALFGCCVYFFFGLGAGRLILQVYSSRDFLLGFAFQWRQNRLSVNLIRHQSSKSTRPVVGHVIQTVPRSRQKARVRKTTQEHAQSSNARSAWTSDHFFLVVWPEHHLQLLIVAAQPHAK